MGTVREDDPAHVPGGECVAHLTGLPEPARHARRLQQRITGTVAAPGASPAAVVVRQARAASVAVANRVHARHRCSDCPLGVRWMNAAAWQSNDTTCVR